MPLHQTLERINDLISARRVFSDPIERDGIVVIPAAQIGGGGGAGNGKAEGQNDGGGMGMRARPIGAFEIRDGKTTWKAAVDWNRVIQRAQLCFLAAYVAREWLRHRRRH